MWVNVPNLSSCLCIVNIYVGCRKRKPAKLIGGTTNCQGIVYMVKAQSHRGYDRLPTTNNQKRCRPPKTIGEHWPHKNVAVTPILIGD